MKTYAVIPVKEFWPMTVHTLTMPDVGEHDYLRQVISSTNFFQSLGGCQGAFTCEPWEKFRARIPEGGYMFGRTFDSIWAFYDSIEYDYKDERYRVV